MTVTPIPDDVDVYVTRLTDDYELCEPVEVRLSRPRLDLSNGPFVLACWVNASNMIGHSLSRRGTGMSEALSNLNRNQTFPHKVVPGWQEEVIAWVMATLDKHGANELEIR